MYSLFGFWFLGMMVFRISYGFTPVFARSKFLNPTLAYVEYYALNIRYYYYIN